MSKWLIGISVVVGAFGLWIYYLSHNNFNEEIVRNKRVLVTGSSKNIGKQLALEFSKLGAHVVVTARNEKRLQEVVAECESLGAASANYVVADMNDLNQTKMLIDGAAALMGGIDILVLNHIQPVPYSLFEWSASESELTYTKEATTVNFLSYVYLSSHSTPYLIESNGRLVVISSLAGYSPMPYTVSYGATKAAAYHFFAARRLALATEKEKTYSISLCVLGYIATESTNEDWKGSVKMKGHPQIDTAREIIAGTA